jgi:SAM-dependent methyltransferase
MVPHGITTLDLFDEMHFVLRMLTDGNHLANLSRSSVSKVLDVGTGSGLWVLEMAAEYPTMSFTGMDVNTFQPHMIKPQNVQFVQANVLERTPFRERSFDYIHVRMMAGSVTMRQWPLALTELRRLLSPGGIIELMDFTGDIDNAGRMHHGFWGPNLMELGTKLNLDFTVWSEFEPLLADAGFLDVQHAHVLLPMGPWAGEVGVTAQTCCMNMLQAYRSGMIGLGIVKNDGEFDKAIKLRNKEVSGGQESLVWSVYVARG